MSNSYGPGKGLVLYADDDTDDLFFVCDAFAPYDDKVEIKTFLDGGQILTYLEKFQPADKLPCLIILDLNMPVVNGKEVLFRVRENPLFKNVPVTVFTTSSFSFDQEFAEKYNATFIVKPLHIEKMKDVIDQFLSFCTMAQV